MLVDDTPLAFLSQPDNGVPCCQFRGDVDDRVLVEATLPLLESLAEVEDVRPLLHRRYDMHSWFLAQVGRWPFISCSHSCGCMLHHAIFLATFGV